MAVLAIPNVSEGTDQALIEGLAGTVRDAGAAVLDIHSDPTHNRSVLTVSGDTSLVNAMARLAVHAANTIDLSLQRGVHPRLGALDVCPFVPHEGSLDDAVKMAEAAARAIHEASGIPVYLYGRASRRPQRLELPDLRRGGLEALIDRAAKGFSPDHGTTIDPRAGVVCVGARNTLIAFNVNLDGDVAEARAIARAVRASNGGFPGVRALGLPLGDKTQVSMNLVDPDETGIDRAFSAVEKEANELGVEIVSTELVGLVPERYLPHPDAKAARLLVEPGRSLEAALKR
ncbi:MAG TPA: glutamate formimidoyltransferase [Actinomycetota bacterium]|nr:glutamate formimidoyltransferase [Actinomycetota bacterium]